jgi:hypothetical protein
MWITGMIFAKAPKNDRLCRTEYIYVQRIIRHRCLLLLKHHFDAFEVFFPYNVKTRPHGMLIIHHFLPVPTNNQLGLTLSKQKVKTFTINMTKMKCFKKSKQELL